MVYFCSCQGSHGATVYQMCVNLLFMLRFFFLEKQHAGYCDSNCMEATKAMASINQEAMLDKQPLLTCCWCMGLFLKQF